MEQSFFFGQSVCSVFLGTFLSLDLGPVYMYTDVFVNGYFPLHFGLSSTPTQSFRSLKLRLRWRFSKLW